MRRQQGRPSYTDRNIRRNRAYIEGNTVRRLDTLPQRQPQEEQQKRERPRVDRQTRANRERALQMNPGYVLFLTLAVVLTVGVCVMYIQLQSDINNRMSNIAALESRILDLRTDNDAALKRVETSINMDEIKNVAINEMGMVYPSQDQIVYFTVDTDDYMNQYQDIPEK